MPAQKRNAHILVKLFVAFHVLAIVIWSLPNPPQSVAEGIVEPQGTMKLLQWNYQTFKVRVPPNEEKPDMWLQQLKYHSPIAYYNLSLGVWQYWDMFAPDPASVDMWGDADIHYKDGTVKRWRYPRMYELPIPEKYVKERYRKFFERAGDSKFSHYIAPIFAQRAAYLSWNDPDNPPVKVVLYVHTMVLPGIGKPLPEEYGEFRFYEWNVDQARLKEMKEDGWTAKSRLLSRR
ncbi:MAG: hypothetical protein KF784_04000 [Fimbriimonadaceae bacterium]|nr:hypothetical protein [Fimbriimonadaceae bacterium]